MNSEKLFHPLPGATKEAWLQQVNKDLKGADFNTKLISENDGIQIQPLYTKDNLPDFVQDASTDFLEDFDEEIISAVHDEGADILVWNICEETNGDAAFLNDLVIASLKRGANCLRIHSNDWDLFFNDIRKINYQHTFMLNVESDLTEENIVNIWRERVGFIGNRDLLISGIEFDPISYFIKNQNIEHGEKSFNNLAQLFFRLTPHLHDCRLIKVDATIFENANHTEQLANALSIAAEYLEQMSERDVPLEELIHLFTFRFSISTDYFFEIAKLRAFKILWTNLLKAFIEEIEFIPNPHLHAVTSLQSADNISRHSNLIRTTTEAMSAILGGCDDLSILPYDENDPDGVRLATHIQNILRYESHFDHYREAANGSFYLETITTQLAEQAWNLFQEIEDGGGILNKVRREK